MSVGILNLSITLPGCSSLKEKRSRLSPLIHRIHDRFNVSISEVDHQDVLDDTCISCAIVSNDRILIENSLHEVVKYLESHWPDEVIYKEEVEIL
jgi:uncharacterized protein YlxP (DUF503 family)